MTRRATRIPSFELTLVALSLLLSACTALTNPDGYHLGGERDAGGPPPPVDAGGRDGGPTQSDAGPPPDCAADETRCLSGNVQACVGGAFVDQELCMLGCGEEGGAHCLRFVPSNVPETLLSPGAGAVVLGGLAAGTSFDTGTCSLTGEGITEIVDQGGGNPELCVVIGDDIRIRSLVVTGPRPLVLLSTGDVRITGAVDLSSEGSGHRGGGGGLGASLGASAEGPGAGEDGSTNASLYDGGGGGGGGCGAGGAGGGAIMDGMDLGGGGLGGSALGTDRFLIPLVGGSGGGAGGDGGGGSETSGGSGGHGGGALQISALGDIIIREDILLGGGGGGGGITAGAGTGGGGGGGSGGNLLLETPSAIRLESPATITANGGGGGAAPNCPSIDGVAGEDAHPSEEPAAGGLRGDPCSGTPRGADGGDGGAGDSVDGVDATTDGPNGGGGGGGAGCFVFRTADGSAPGFSIPMSPFAGTPSVRVTQVQLR